MRLRFPASQRGGSGTNLALYSFMAHPETLLPMPTIDDPTERFLSVVKFYLSGWHIKPPYVCSAQHILCMWRFGS